jgi:hypothetical protein
MRTSHKVPPDILTDMKPVMLASADTADDTQRKHLWASVGKAWFRVTRRRSGFSNERAETVFEGRSLTRAIHFYNGMG